MLEAKLHCWQHKSSPPLSVLILNHQPQQHARETNSNEKRMKSRARLPKVFRRARKLFSPHRPWDASQLCYHHHRSGHDNALNNETIYAKAIPKAFSEALSDHLEGTFSFGTIHGAQSRWWRLECGVLSLRQEIILLNGNNYSCYTSLLG